MDDLFAHAPALPPTLEADRWLAHLFSAKSAIRGTVVRRKARDVERIVGWPRFRHELRRRGYRAVRNGSQVIVFCNAEPIHPI
ncbi:N-(5'-phosphoribosyl)anthranilate isomerase [Rhodobacteraceae bacterium N5(2021)]|uniref:N-(5'-phosphoribosyl)anthranilate isomerase n=1 Tax=Gymnodinialimonas phycosphaerae TaxID=2841589 RepID=A0A975TWV5_9RHOB|nr:N-(5'-phosphoribosyl)anthranilate isomerase [Gymnodinialimonas phycosphaerae]MBY4892415.1 N-(5'-phosphoribosyl)anthranilate isomerase [Gymnodinialimonas phycosphaerae]